MPEFNKLLSNSNAMPPLESFETVRSAKAWERGQPVVLIALDTASNECKNVAPFYEYLHARFPRLHFL